MTNDQWLALRVSGAKLEHDDYVISKISEPRKAGRIYPAANDWMIFRDPSLSKGAWNWIAERTTKGSVELRGFDHLKHARSWCVTSQ